MFTEIAMLVLINIGTVGGLLWAVLHFGLSRKLAEMKSVHEAALKLQHLEHESAAKIQHANHEAQLKRIQAQLDSSLDELTHARNTVFKRYDEKRAAAILKLEAALFSFTWASVNLTMPKLDNTPVVALYLAKTFELNSLANDVMQVAGENAFFYSAEFRAKVAVLWYPRARALSLKSTEVGVILSEDGAFSEKDRSEQAAMLRDKLNAETSLLSKAVSEAGRELSAQLERWFKESTVLSSDEYQTLKTSAAMPAV